MQMTPDRLLELVCRIERVIAEQVEAALPSAAPRPER
jgi:hypothetical protein